MDSITSDDSNREVMDGDCPDNCPLCFERCDYCHKIGAKSDLLKFQCGHIYHTACFIAEHRRTKAQMMPPQPIMALPETVLPATGLTSTQSQFAEISTNSAESNLTIDDADLEHLGWGLSPDVERRLRRNIQIFLASSAAGRRNNEEGESSLDSR